MLTNEQDPRDVLCPRCGAEAEWSFADAQRTQVKVACPDCGSFELPRAEFTHLETELAALEERS